MTAQQTRRPAISVVIPAYNEEKYLGACLKSLRRQSFRRPYEIIVVDNSSTDSTPALAQKAGARVISETRKGMVFALIAGVNAARAEIVAVTDADTVVPRQWLERIWEAFATNRTAVAVTGPLQFYQGLPEGKKRQELVKKFSPRLISAYLSGPNMAFRKAAYTAVGGFKPQVNLQMDTYLGRQLRKQGKIVLLRDNVVATSGRRISSQSLGGIVRELAVRSANLIWIRLFNKTLFQDFINFR